MKNIFYSAILILIFLVGCTPTPPPTPPNSNPHGIYVDSSVFFKLTFQGRTIANYEVRSTEAYYDNLLNNYRQWAYIRSYSGTQNFNNLGLGVSCSSLNAELQSLGFLSFKNQIDIVTVFDKLGTTPLGVYSFGSNDALMDYSSSVVKAYAIAGTLNYPNSYCTLTVTSIDQNFVAGTLNFYLIDNNNLIPAIGSFRLHKS